jgi:putative membrane protein
VGVEPLAVEPSWPELALAAALVVAYARAERAHPSSRGRRLAFAGGIALLIAVFASPLQKLSTDYLLSAHLFQNVVLAEWVPLLLLAGLGRAAAERLGRLPVLRTVSRPQAALPIWLATYVVWHVPVVYETALRHPRSLLHLEHGSYLVAGLLFWWPVLHHPAWARRSARKAGYVFAAFLLASPLGVALALLPDPLYGFYEDAPRVWGISALLDQQIAGALMSIAEAVVFFAVFAVLVLRFLREEEEREEARRASGAGAAGPGPPAARQGR